MTRNTNQAHVNAIISRPRFASLSFLNGSFFTVTSFSFFQTEMSMNSKKGRINELRKNMKRKKKYVCEIEFPGIFRKREKDPFFSNFFAYLPLKKIVGEGEKKRQ